MDCFASLAMTWIDRRTINEATMRLHLREQARWNAVHRRHIQSAEARIRASRGARERLFGQIWLQSAGLVRSARNDDRGDHPGEADQGRKPRQEISADRSTEPRLEGPLRYV